MRIQDLQGRRKSKRSQVPSLTKILTGMLVVGGAIVAVWRFSDWFSGDFVAGEVRASGQGELSRVEALIEDDQPAEAAKLLKPMLARIDDQAVTPKALLLQAQLDADAGKLADAKGHLKRAYEDYPGSAEQPIAGLKYARMLEDSGAIEEAMPIYESIRAAAPAEFRAGATAGLARELERKGDLQGARELFSKAYREAIWKSETWEDAAAGLGRVNVGLIFSPAAAPDSKVYEVVSGDSLTNIGIKLNTTQGLLTRANNVGVTDTLRLGQRLKYTPKDFRIVIERSTCRLYLMDSDGLFKVYRVGLGKPGNETSCGQYKIGNKEKDPTWFKPGSEPIPPLDPRNELGTRWMPLVPEEEALPSDLGIHGTIRPESIGNYESMGCPRMIKDDVEELYDLVVRSTPVTIVETLTPEQAG